MNQPDNSYTVEQFKEILDSNNFQSTIYPDTEYAGKPYKYLTFQFPVARNTEDITIFEDDDLYAIANCNFTKFRGISNYEAIWSKELNIIECEIQNTRFGKSNRFILRNLSSIFDTSSDLSYENIRNDPSEVVIFSNDSLKVTIGLCSKEITFLSTYKEGRHIDINQRRYGISMKIENISIDTEEAARLLLEKISNSLFFQLSVLYSLVFTLTPRRIPRAEKVLRRKRLQNTNMESRALKLEYEYEKTPMSLYWFAQNNIDSPIFAFFAFYQVLEYYFPIYSQSEAKNRIKNLFKDPRFNLDSDADMMRLLNVITAKNIDVIGDEREQLNNVLKNLISGDEIIDFIKSREFLMEYYVGKDSNKLSNEKLPINDTTGIIPKLSTRIYDIRCRIVHNKASDTHKKILPITKEEDCLRNEIYILKYLAEKALIINSKTFHIY